MSVIRNEVYCIDCKYVKLHKYFNEIISEYCKCKHPINYTVSEPDYITKKTHIITFPEAYCEHPNRNKHRNCKLFEPSAKIKLKNKLINFIKFLWDGKDHG